MNILHIPFRESTTTSSDWVSIYKNGTTPAASDKAMPTAVMPSLQGMGLKDAVYLCENIGLKVRVKGVGKVTAQSINSGNKINKGQIVNIELN
jgi:cell division protein FtsI (penicillin-binding protein 3)